MNVAKSAVARPDTRHFLGYRLVPSRGQSPGVGLSERSEKRLWERLKELTPRREGRSLSAIISQVNAYLRGWLGHFGVCTPVAERALRGADAHLRRRLRAIVLTHWKRRSTIARRLARLGVKRKTAWIRTYAGSRATWALSHDSAVERGLRNAYFAERGLVSLVDTFKTRWQSQAAPVQLELPWVTERS
ncbi:MAG: hypothetical protein KF878_05635 [Planctomycetes bacterium]|nr:hypothetical protein [Planctomycetota bacterium]